MKKIGAILMIGLLLTLCFSCIIESDGSKAKGKVVDMITGQPLSNAIITASTKTNIEEDKKFEQKSAKSDANGDFLVKGLSEKYTYSFTATKEGYSIASKSHFSPPEKGQTKLFEEPFKIVKVPTKEGVYSYSNGNLDEINQIKLKKEIFAINPHNSQKPTKQVFFYSEKPESEISKDEKEAIIIYLPKKNMFDNHYFRKLTFFDKLLTCTQSKYYKRKASWAPINQKNIFIEGAKESAKIANTIDYYYRWEKGYRYSNPQGTIVRIGIPSIEGSLPSEKIEIQNGYFWVVLIQNLPKGYYTISQSLDSTYLDNKDNGMRWAFEKI